MKYTVAAEKDLPFIMEVYNQNIEALHGNNRSNEVWSNEEQLENYIVDLIGNRNSLTLGYFDGDKLAVLSRGHVKHWYSATEYYFDDGIC